MEIAYSAVQPQSAVIMRTVHLPTRIALLLAAPATPKRRSIAAFRSRLGLFIPEMTSIETVVDSTIPLAGTSLR